MAFHTGIAPVFPRIRPTSLDEIRFVFRWCFSKEELSLFSEKDLDSVPTDLSAVVWLTLLRHGRRRLPFCSSDCGWMRTQLLTITARPPMSYLLSFALKDSGEWIDERALEECFDHAQVSRLEEISLSMVKTFEDALTRQREFCLGHWREERRIELKKCHDHIDQTCTARIAKLEERLTSIKTDLRQLKRTTWTDESNGTAAALAKQQAECRQELMDAESKELQMTRELLNFKAGKQEYALRTLFTIRWLMVEGRTALEVRAPKKKRNR